MGFNTLKFTNSSLCSFSVTIAINSGDYRVDRRVEEAFEWRVFWRACGRHGVRRTPGPPMMEGWNVPVCGINMPEMVRWIHYHRFNESVWNKGKLLYTRACSMAAVLPRHGGKLLVQCCAVKSTSLVHRAPTTTLRWSTLMVRHIVVRGLDEGPVCLFFPYINARNVSTSSVSERNSAIDRVLRILLRSSDSESRVALRVDCIYWLLPREYSFPCMYVLIVNTIEFHWKIID